jgi:nicotinamidase/pyrazinamidase
MNKLLVVVDMQYDFIEGALGTKEATEIVNNVVNKISEYKKNGDQIIFTMDTHNEDYLTTMEGKKLPVMHCIKDTNGWNISNAIQEKFNLEQYKVYAKNTFGSSELAKDIIDGVYNDIIQVELIGICTDICVISNAILVKTFLPNIPIIVDASCCAGVTVNSHRNALEAMKMCHIDIIGDK